MVEWKGAYGLFASDFSLGFISENIFAGDAFLKMDYINGKRGEVTVKMFGVGVDIGVGWFGPFTLESAPIKCEAPMDPNAFTGRFSISNIGVTFYAMDGMFMGSALCDLRDLKISTDLFVIINSMGLRKQTCVQRMLTS